MRDYPGAGGGQWHRGQGWQWHDFGVARIVLIGEACSIMDAILNPLRIIEVE
jgi:hypothetical protein